MLRAAACWRHQGGVIARRALFPRASLSRVLPQALMMQMSTLPDGVSPMTMPALSPTMTAGTVAAWLKKEGEALRPGDVLCQVQTDKAVVDYEVQDDAVLAKILVKEGGEEVPVGTTLAFTVEDEDTFASLTKSGALAQLQADAGSEAAPEATPEPASTPAPKEAEAEPHRQPLIKFLGKRSLLPAEPEAAPAAAAAAPTASASATTGAPKAAPVVPGAPVASEDFVDMALSNMRKVVAKRLSASKSEVPHHYASIDCEIDDVLAFRKTLKKKHDIRVSLNDIMVRAVALALRDVPEANCTFDTTTQTVKPNPSVDISVAVATAAGLITPIVPHVDALGLAGVNTKLVELIQKARENRLKLEEFQGGSFTISNLGGFGIDNFSAVINPPQSCILAIGRGRQELLPGDAKSEEDGEIQPRVATLLNVTLSADRRVVDDVVAGEFLQAFKMYMENPELLTL